MREDQATFKDFGIELPYNSHGEVRATCPQCTPNRKPQHQRDKDLSVNVEEGVFHCFHCQWSGTLKKPLYPKKVYEAPRPLPEVTIPDMWRNAVTWFGERNIPEDILVEMGVTASKEYCPVCDGQVGNVLFPYYVDGEHTNTKHRCGKKHFRMEKGAQRVLYNLDGIKNEETVIFVEGELDCLSLKAAGIHNVVSVPDGAPAADAKNYSSKFSFLEAAESHLEHVQQFILATDADEPGQKLMNELARRIGPEKCLRVLWDHGIKDANECLVQAGPEYLKCLIEDAKPFPVEGIVTAHDAARELDDLYDKGLDRGYTTGYPTLDRFYRVAPAYMTIVVGIPGHGKALGLNTNIPTPDGFKLMGEIEPGDRVFDENGMPCNVVAVTEEQHDRPCYLVEFSDGARFVADAAHEWLTRDDRARISERNSHHKRGDREETKPGATDQRYKRTYPRIRETKEIAETLYSEGGKRANHSIPVAGALQLPTADLPVPPYTLGAWLGDGTSKSTNLTSADVGVVEAIRDDGFVVDRAEYNGPYGWVIRGLWSLLASLGVMGRKHVPDSYLWSSEAQRRELLAGLMDTDGSVTSYGRCEFTSTNQLLALHVHHLVSSLGYIAGFIEGRAMLNGKDCGSKYRVTFTPDKSVFKMERKAKHCRTGVSGRRSYRQVVSCTPIESEPVKCIQVDSLSHLYLIGHEMIPTHNSGWVDQIIVRLAERYDWTFTIFSPEQQPVQKHFQHLIELHAGVPMLDGPTQRMTKMEMHEALEWVGDRFSILTPEDPSIDTILKLARIEVFRRGIKGIVIDPWNELEHLRPNGSSETEYIGEALSKFRRFAIAHQVHVWLVVHPTKMRKLDDGSEPIPTLYDCSGSANFRNKADMGITVWRDVSAKDSRVQAHITKVRYANHGEVGAVQFAYDPPTKRLMELGEI